MHIWEPSNSNNWIRIIIKRMFIRTRIGIRVQFLENRTFRTPKNLCTTFCKLRRTQHATWGCKELPSRAYQGSSKRFFILPSSTYQGTIAKYDAPACLRLGISSFSTRRQNRRPIYAKWLNAHVFVSPTNFVVFCLEKFAFSLV